MCFISMHHTTRPHYSCFVSVPADFVYFPAQRGFSIITRDDVDSARVCFPITCYNCWWSVSQEYILHKKMRKGGRKNSMCHKKYQKIQFHTCDRDPSTYHEYDIHRLLTLLYYSTYTILKLVPALRYVFPHDAIVSSTNTQQICSTTVQNLV